MSRFRFLYNIGQDDWDLNSISFGIPLGYSDFIDITDSITDPEIWNFLQKGDLVLTSEHLLLMDSDTGTDILGLSIDLVAISSSEDFISFLLMAGGISGYSGFSGYSGMPGAFTASGLSGTSGYSGKSGSSGVSGEKGDIGLSGSSGYSGMPGAFTASGLSGTSGYSGESSYSGVSGYSGALGEKGDIGLSGSSGYSGMPGAFTASGLSGTSGTSGFSGASGTSGASGISGYSGTSGGKGDIGLSGSSGYSGMPGAFTASGLSGTSGASGLSGLVSPYTNALPSILALGGIAVGTTFTNMQYTDFVERLLYPYPTLIDPSLTFTGPATYQEIGATISATFTAAFNRGSISPQYPGCTSPYRSGLPNSYIYTGSMLVIASPNPLHPLTDTQTITYVVLSGNQSWTCRIAYDAGVQPKDSRGADYDFPKVAGSTGSVSKVIYGVYPFFATTSVITTMTKQLPLVSMTSTYVQTNMVAESGSYKQTIDFPIAWNAIKGVQFLNTLSNTWEFINGSRANSLLTFTQTPTTHVIPTPPALFGSTINYTRYTHNGSTTGSRQLRWYTT